MSQKWSLETEPLGRGEFAVTSFSDTNLIRNQSSTVNIGGGVFQNFCVSYDDVIFGNVNDWTISNTVVTGFPGRPSHILTSQTAYLFTQFWNGTLGNYDYTAGSGRVESAMALQLAIWEFEQGLFQGDPFPSQSQAWFDEANIAVAPGGSWYGTGLGDVRVLNLTLAGDVQQSVLVRAVPEPSTFALIGIGLVALGIAHKRSKT